MNNATPIGVTDFRSTHSPFGIKDWDRLAHIYCIGKSGTGKSTLLLNMAISDIERGNGLAIIDPHGDVADGVLAYIPQNRIEDVVYFNVADFDFPIAFNPLGGVVAENKHLVAASLIATFKKLWVDSWGPRLEHILRFSILTLLEYPGSTLIDLQHLLTKPNFRKIIVGTVTSSHIREFWTEEFDKYTPGLRAEALSPVLNKLGAFLAHAHVRNIVGQQKSSFHVREIMDSRKILICNLSKGRIGDDASALLGAMLLTSIQSAALARANQPEGARVPFYVYVDEMHSFMTLSFADMLAEARKYKLGLFITHQYIEQLDERVRTAIFGNVGTLISFRVGARDAEYLARELYPVFRDSDLVHLPRYAMYLKLMIDGMTSKPFSAVTVPMKERTGVSRDIVILASRQAYGRSKVAVEHNAGKHAVSEQEQRRTLF